MSERAHIHETARSYFTDEMSPAHDWHHVQRVKALAGALLDAHEADPDVLFPAVLLHDIGRAASPGRSPSSS